MEELFRQDVDPFDEQDINQNALMEVIRRKKRNTLYTLFKKDCSFSVEKRKRSPEDETVNKMRRMTLGEVDSFSFKTPGGGIKMRRNTVSTMDSGRRKPGAARTKSRCTSQQSPGPKQRLITQFLEDKSKIDDDEL